jgi:hypothetical protein
MSEVTAMDAQLAGLDERAQEALETGDLELYYSTSEEYDRLAAERDQAAHTPKRKGGTTDEGSTLAGQLESLEQEIAKTAEHGPGETGTSHRELEQRKLELERAVRYQGHDDVMLAATEEDLAIRLEDLADRIETLPKGSRRREVAEREVEALTAQHVDLAVELKARGSAAESRRLFDRFASERTDELLAAGWRQEAEAKIANIEQMAAAGQLDADDLEKFATVKASLGTVPPSYRREHEARLRKQAEDETRRRLPTMASEMRRR